MASKVINIVHDITNRDYLRQLLTITPTNENEKYTTTGYQIVSYYDGSLETCPREGRQLVIAMVENLLPTEFEAIPQSSIISTPPEQVFTTVGNGGSSSAYHNKVYVRRQYRKAVVITEKLLGNISSSDVVIGDILPHSVDLDDYNLIVVGLSDRVSNVYSSRSAACKDLYYRYLDMFSAKSICRYVDGVPVFSRYSPASMIVDAYRSGVPVIISHVALAGLLTAYRRHAGSTAYQQLLSDMNIVSFSYSSTEPASWLDTVVYGSPSHSIVTKFLNLTDYPTRFYIKRIPSYDIVVSEQCVIVYAISGASSQYVNPYMSLSVKEIGGTTCTLIITGMGFNTDYTSTEIASLVNAVSYCLNVNPEEGGKIPPS